MIAAKQKIKFIKILFWVNTQMIIKKPLHVNHEEKKAQLFTRHFIQSQLS